MRILARLFMAIVVLLGVAAVAVRFSTGLQDAIVRRMAIQRVGHEHAEVYDRDALRIFFCGTGSPVPDRVRGQACTGVFAGGHFFLVDTGVGSADRLTWAHVPTGGLDGVLFTHFHSDHIAGLPDVVLNSWVSGRTKPLKLYGGPGIEDVAKGFAMAFAADASYRTAHHTAAYLPESGGRLEGVQVDVPPGDGAVTVFHDGDLRIQAFHVTHPPIEPAYGYRIDYKDRSVVFSGDTTAGSPLVKVGAKADVMVHEALAPHMLAAATAALAASGDARRAKILGDTPGYHTSPVDAAKDANAAGVRLLVLSHLVPAVNGRFPEQVFLRGVEDVRKDGTMIATEGLLLTLPTGSAEIRQQLLD